VRQTHGLDGQGPNAERIPPTSRACGLPDDRKVAAQHLLLRRAFAGLGQDELAKHVARRREDNEQSEGSEHEESEQSHDGILRIEAFRVLDAASVAKKRIRPTEVLRLTQDRRVLPGSLK